MDQKSNVRLVRQTVENKLEVDIYVKDAYGKEHVIYPKQKKTLLVVKRSKHDRKRVD
jgi:hypothetical protein